MQPRDQMINTAVALFQSGGYQATSWRKLVEKAGTPWGSAHHYFPGGKTQLGVAAIERAAEAVALLIDHAFPEGATPAQGVRNLFTGSAAMLEKSAFRAGCPIATVALETVPDTPQMAEACAAALERYHAALAAGLARTGVQARKAKPLATTILAAFEGALILARTRRSTEPLTTSARHLAVLLEA